ncbi:TSUP family transporter [Aeromicrobium duanguangcaii]|uniref:Probable membrane transporter protein n=1 Tax=Aeromicrobium duanguangcaii TaxID=2968086 RepID=A0ABY5KEG5_9ACTN|nr:TSUP family transporter [Aeromicrobium duanguangcaii]MCD9155171.1 TSUP family transporter [Aeromicrobium duanguangcaii]UUI68178.1 TSUP family transporter [Aeromicrobium duanguangcaii]
MSDQLLAGLSSGDLVLLAVLVGAFAQATTGMGFSLVAAPVLIAVRGPAEGVALVVLLAACSSVLPLLREGRHAQRRDALRLLVPTLAATPVIAWALAPLDHTWLAVAGGIGVVIGVAMLASGWRSAWLRRPVGTIATGITSAGLNVVGGVGGPPVGLYAANSTWTPAQTRGTLHTFLIVQNLVTAVVVGLVLPSWQMLAALGVGTVVGLVVAPRLSVGAARTGILCVSAVGGMALLLSAA